MARHRPEQTALFQLIERYYPTFLAAIESRGGALPSFVRRAFEDCPDRRRASAARSFPLLAGETVPAHFVERTASSPLTWCSMPTALVKPPERELSVVLVYM